MENCVHEKIVSLRDAETQLPVMWMCTDCRLKFIPITQAAAEMARETEAIAKMVESVDPALADAIRARI